MSRIFLNSGTLIVIVGFQFFFIRIKGYIVTHPFPEQGSNSSLSGSRVPISPYPDQGFQFLLIQIVGFQFLIIRIKGSNFSLSEYYDDVLDTMRTIKKITFGIIMYGVLSVCTVLHNIYFMRLQYTYKIIRSQHSHYCTRYTDICTTYAIQTICLMDIARTPFTLFKLWRHTKYTVPTKLTICKIH